MWYWDYTPSSWGRAKPLTKAQIRKLQESYRNADKITAEVREIEAKETTRIQSDIDDALNFL